MLNSMHFYANLALARCVVLDCYDSPPVQTNLSPAPFHLDYAIGEFERQLQASLAGLTSQAGRMRSTFRADPAGA